MRKLLLILLIFLAYGANAQLVSFIFHGDTLWHKNPLNPADSIQVSKCTHNHPISDVTNLQTSLNGKEPSITAGNSTQYYRGDKTFQTLDKTAVGLSNVTNESKATMFTSPTFTGTVSGVTASMVGLGNVNNTSDANKPVSTATQTALDNKSTIYFGTDAGSNDSYVITASPVPASYTTGMMVIFKANTQNTTGCTINVNGLGVKTIVKRVNTTPATGDILALMFCQLVYDGTNFVLLNPVVN